MRVASRLSMVFHPRVHQDRLTHWCDQQGGSAALAIDPVDKL